VLASEDPETVRMLAEVLPLYEGETILWFRKEDHGYSLRVRTADGFEGMHDVYDFQLGLKGF